MNVAEFKGLVTQIPTVRDAMYDLMVELFPICRSITGNGVRRTLKIISKHIPLDIHEVPTGTKVFDWQIPKEWNIDDAYVIGPDGKKIIDFKKSNLHVLNYSIPIHKKISLDELKRHIHTLPEKPDLIPYLTSYYNENWGFCMKHNDFLKLKEGEYEVVIDSSLKKGSLTYGEYFLKGNSKDELLFSCYVCHPSLCNDNLSGVVLTTMLAKHLNKTSNNYSMRFLFIPETIGAITWLFLNQNRLSNIKNGLVVTCVGDSGPFTYKKSRRGNTEIDKTVIEVLKNSRTKYRVVDFFPYGSDERQFCSPGFNLPIGSLYRSQYASHEFPEYHTSGDNLEFVKSEALADSYSKYLTIVYTLEQNKLKQKKFIEYDQNMKQNLITKQKLTPEQKKKYLNLNPKCEPQLSKRGLYRTIGAVTPSQAGESLKNQYALLWVLNLSDGKHSLFDIAQRSGYDFKIIQQAANLLYNNNLLSEMPNEKN